MLKSKGEINGSAINAVILSDADFDTLKGGVCAALTAAWLKETLGSTKTFVGDFSGPGVQSGRNLQTVRDAAPQHLADKGDILSGEALRSAG